MAVNPLKIEQQSVYNQRKGVLFFMFPLEIGLKRFIFVMFNLTWPNVFLKIDTILWTKWKEKEG